MKEASSNRQFSCRKQYNIESIQIHKRRIWNTLQKGKQIHLTCLLSWRPHWFSSLQFAILRQKAMDQHQASHPSFWSTEQGMAFTSQTQLFKLAHPSVWILAHIPPNKQNHLKVLFFFFPFFILPSFWIFLNHFFLLFKLFLFSNLVVLTNECRILEAVVQSTKATVSCSDSSYLFFCFLVFILFFICRLSLRLLRLSHYRLQAQPVAATKK